MHQTKRFFFLFLFLSVFYTISCRKDKLKETPIISRNFESGSIGQAERTSDTSWNLYLADDNDNSSLPATWRSWWYVRADHLAVGQTLSFTLKNSGWTYYYLPVYSYDQTNWLRFDETEVKQNDSLEIVITKAFARPTVYMARFYPYGFSDLQHWLNRVKTRPHFQLFKPGYTQQKYPVYLIKLTDETVAVSEKKRVFIHARTHPAETPPSFAIEGLVDFLTDGSAEADDCLARFEFYIFPMQNVDGVIAGNYRSTPQSENLEVLWNRHPELPFLLDPDVPAEVKTIHQYALDLMQDGGPGLSVALNLHASNSMPDTRTFFFPHFGPLSAAYTPAEAALWDKQINFIAAFTTHAGQALVEPPPAEGGRGFVQNAFPESWWWNNYNEQVMAMTLEMTYGRAGYAPAWVTPPDMRLTGKALARAIRDYLDHSLHVNTVNTTAKSNLPFTEEESKQ